LRLQMIQIIDMAGRASCTFIYLLFTNYFFVPYP
jgi:hypothetical protein